ncbi:hypothetical protein IFT92_09280 [Peribacillus simplex]|uniref:hypothetical protein n=1 Tax=Peribacillus TaxID=2675229 RepID=UPI0019210CE3|nr:MULTISPECIES: hypothetical protein [Peribacillus]MBD8588003.1 hypothetical protein [Peribacillus simplex]MEA3575339.1 hypothetical protein [Peribacillus frigoritolerans]
MGYVVIALLLLVITSVMAFVLTGNSQLIAKEMKEEIVTGTLGKVVLGGFLGLLVAGILVLTYLHLKKLINIPTLLMNWI